MIRPVPTLLAVAIASACSIAHAEPAAAPDETKLLDRMTVVGSTEAAQ